MVRSVRLQPVAPPVLLALPVLAVSLLAAGCGAGQTAPTAQRPAAEHSAAGHSADEHAAAMTAALGTPAAPPATATMVCGQDIKSKVKQVLTLPAEPATSSTWANGIYTCRYALPVGPMVLSVQVLPDAAQAGAQLDAQRAQTAGAATLEGLGQRAWGTPAGTAVVLKDNQILTVDTTALPPVFGVNDQKRTDLAYEVASDVLGCWTGDDS